MSTSTYSSSAPWSWTSESDFDSDHELTIVVLHKEISVRLQGYLSKERTGECGKDLLPGPGRPDNLCLELHVPQPAGHPRFKTSEGPGAEGLRTNAAVTERKRLQHERILPGDQVGPENVRNELMGQSQPR